MTPSKLRAAKRALELVVFRRQPVRGTRAMLGVRIAASYPER